MSTISKNYEVAAKVLATLKAVYDWADNHEDITETGHPNDAMTVKGMIHDLMGDDFIYANWKPNALKPAGVTRG